MGRLSFPDISNKRRMQYLSSQNCSSQQGFRELPVTAQKDEIVVLRPINGVCSGQSFQSL